MRRLLLPLFAIAASACAAPATTTPVNTPSRPEVAKPAPRAPRAVNPEALTVQGPLREEWIPLLKAPVIDPAKVPLPAPPAALAPAPAACDAFVKRAAVAAPKCNDATSALAALDAALAESDSAQRDARLLGVEACAALPAGVARALRAELAPVECGEAITGPILDAARAAVSAGKPSTNGAVYQALVGLAVASRLARAATAPPTLAPPHTRARVVEFTKGPMATWFGEQAKVIQEVSQNAVELAYYAKAIAAVEAGMAEMRLVDVVRSAPIPEEIAKDRDLRNEYYASLDQSLDPRKDRGRDAALVGLRDLALVGVIRDDRVTRARSLLSRLYGGRRVDALDALLLPALPPAAPSTVEERLAGKLPTFYAGVLLDEKAATRPGTLRMFLDKGIPLPQRHVLKTAQLGPEARSLHARARVELARLYWRAVDVDQAIALTSTWPEGAPRPDDATFVLALALALRGGPDDTVEMMRRAPLPLAGIGKVDALDYVAQKTSGPTAAMAAYDAALIRQLAAPEGAGAEHWRDVAARFREAAALLPAGPERATAEERASAADQIAAAIK